MLKCFFTQPPRKDDFDKAVNMINSLYSAYLEQKELIEAMSVKLEERDKEIEQLNAKCSDQSKSLETLENEIATKNGIIEKLTKQLENQSLLERMSSTNESMEDDCFDTSDNEASLHANARAPSHSFSFTVGKHDHSPRRTLSDVPHLSKVWANYIYIDI